MKLDRRLALALLAAGRGAGGLAGARRRCSLRATLDPEQRAALDAALGRSWRRHGAAGARLVARGAALGGLGGRAGSTRRTSPRRRGSRTRPGSWSATPPAPDARARRQRTRRAHLAEAINGLADQRRALRADMARLVDEASRKVALERDQLGALMAELDQSVVVCNLDGRILLYNGRARAALPPALARARQRRRRRADRPRPLDPRRDRPRADRPRARNRRAPHRPRRGRARPRSFVTTTPAGHLLRVEPGAGAARRRRDAPQRLRAAARRHHRRLRAPSPAATGSCSS